MDPSDRPAPPPQPAEWVQELFESSESPGPPGHGLSQRNLDEGVAYYTFEHGPLSFIAMDSVNRFPNVIARISGNSHESRVTARPDPEGRRGGGYWEVNTTSPVAYPMQGRLLAVVDNRDDTVSLFSTVYNLAAPVDPREATDPTVGDEVNEEQLAAVARGD